MEQPLISVIIPVYKVEAYLDRCLETVVHQTYKNLEIILVDDGSPDRCPAICDAWAARDSRIRVIHKANGGLSDARNCGLRAASGLYVSFVDSDDWLSLVMLEKMAAAMAHYQADMVMCQFVYVHTDGVCGKSVQHDYPDEVLSPIEAIKLLLEDTRVTSHIWRKLYKRSLIPADVFPLGKYFEDIYVMHRLFLNCQKIVCLHDAYYFYRQNKAGIVYSHSIACLQDYLEGTQLRHQALAAIPELKDNCKQAEVLSVRTALMDLKRQPRDNPALEPVRSMLVKRIRRIKTMDILRLLHHGHLAPTADVLLLKLTHQWEWKIEQFVYDHLLCDHCLPIKALRETRAPLRNIRRMIHLYRETADGGKRFWVFCTPPHGNLGDRALELAERQFVTRYFPDYQFCKVPLGQTDGVPSWMIARLVRPGSFCAIHAGGNIGTLYPSIHASQERTIRALQKKKLLVFPQTFYYSDDPAGDRALRQTQKVYEQCKHLCLFARERTSYEFLKKNFPATQRALMPDMALFLPPYRQDKPRHDAMLGIRPDAERIIADKTYGYVLSLLEKRFGRVSDFDTHVYRDLTDSEAEREITKLWDQMAGAEIVVTDRLHGMIFAAVTQTPCVLLLSKSHKIEGVYQWASSLPYVRLCCNIEDLATAVEQVLSAGTPVYQVAGLSEKFDEMASIIRKMQEG